MPSVNYTLGSNVENLTLVYTCTINGTGNELANSIMGNSANNILTGDDTLNGGTGTDTMIGKAGDGTYYVDIRLSPHIVPSLKTTVSTLCAALPNQPCTRT